MLGYFEHEHDKVKQVKEPTKLPFSSIMCGIWNLQKVRVARLSDEDPWKGFSTTFHIKADENNVPFRIVLHNVGRGLTHTCSIPRSVQIEIHRELRRVCCSILINKENSTQTNYEILATERLSDMKEFSVTIKYTEINNEFDVLFNGRSKVMTKVCLKNLMNVGNDGSAYIGFYTRGSNVRTYYQVESWDWINHYNTPIAPIQFIPGSTIEPLIKLLENFQTEKLNELKQLESSQQHDKSKKKKYVQFEVLLNFLDLLPPKSKYTIESIIEIQNKYLQTMREQVEHFLTAFYDTELGYSKQFQTLFENEVKAPLYNKIIKLCDRIEVITEKQLYYSTWENIFSEFNSLKYNLFEFKQSIYRAIDNFPETGTMIEDYGKMVNTDTCSDCSFQVENKIFYGHKVIFLCRCPDFFYQYISPASSYPITFSEVSSEVFFNFLRFIYSSQVENDLMRESIVAFWSTFSKLEINWSFQQYMIDLANAFQDSSLCDISFQLEDGEVKAHKSILIFRNHFFKALMNSGMKESQQSEIVLPDLHKETFESLMRYLYSGFIDHFTPNDAMELLCTCSHIMDSRLNQICETILLYEIDVDVVIPLLEMATYYNSDRLQKFCFDFLTKNFIKIFHKEEFRNMDPLLSQKVYAHVSPQDLLIFDKWKKIQMCNTSVSTKPAVPKKVKRKENLTPAKVPEKQEVEDSHTLQSCEICHKKSDMRCSRCHSVFYCSSDHQKQDWKQHKVKCIQR